MKAPAARRIRRDPETTRTLILNMAEHVMVNEGYAAVTSRRIAQEIGINPATVHYYYATTDDLFIALHRRMTEQQMIDLDAILAGGNPVRAFWDFQAGWDKSALGLEFIALANHRKSIRDIIVKTAITARDAQEKALAKAIAKNSGDQDMPSPLALAAIMVMIARGLANEERIGLTFGHNEVRSVVRQALDKLTGKPPRSL